MTPARLRLLSLFFCFVLGVLVASVLLMMCLDAEIHIKNKIKSVVVSGTWDGAGL